MRNPLKRAPDVEVVVEASESTTSAEAMAKCFRMNLLCRNYDMFVIRAEGGLLTLRGRPKQADAFVKAHAILRQAGAV